jgi:6-phosphogluconate dehydrogenase
MKLGLIGLGRMGAGIAARLGAAGIECVVHDVSPQARAAVCAPATVSVAESPSALVARLPAPRAIWLMVPAAAVDDALQSVLPHLEAGDIVIDGGNSHPAEAGPRAARCAGLGVRFLDVGTSGGIHGRDRGYCLMIGGDPQAVQALAPVFEALAPGSDAAPPLAATVVRVAGSESRGWLHCGPTGAGHFAKMVHNGIEYGLMAAYAEGFNLLARAGGSFAATAAPAPDAPAPATLDVAAIAELWRHGSVIGSWLLDLAATELAADPALGDASPRVGDSGEGRWVVQSAVDLGVPVPVMAAALFSRFDSRGESEFADRVLSAMRRAFGGHGGAQPPPRS